MRPTKHFLIVLKKRTTINFDQVMEILLDEWDEGETHFDDENIQAHKLRVLILVIFFLNFDDEIDHLVERISI